MNLTRRLLAHLPWTLCYASFVLNVAVASLLGPLAAVNALCAVLCFVSCCLLFPE